VDAALRAGLTRDAAAMVADFSSKNEAGESPGTRQLTHQEQLFPLILEERKLLDTYGPKHPEVLAVRNRIEATRRLLLLPPTAWDGASKNAQDGKRPPVDPVQAHVQMLRQKLEYIKISEGLLTKLYETEYAEARRLAAYEIQDESFRSGIALNNQLYETLVKRLGEASLVRGGYDVEALEPPLAGRKVAPNGLLFLSLGAFLGGLLALGLAWWADVRDTRFRSRSEVATHLGVEVLGAIPGFRPISKKRAAAGPPLDRRLCTHHSNGSAEAEAFRGLRNALCFKAEGDGQRVIQVTGPCGREGTSTVAANLSISLAQAGKKVLLIDANLRAPCLHRLFELPPGPGLAALIAGAAEPAQTIQDSGLPGLAVVACGPVGSSPGELFACQPFQDFLAGMRQRYDFIIVDTPGVLPVSDAAAIARGADVVLLTIHLARTSRAHAERAVEILAAAGAKALGVVLNGAEEHRLPNEYVLGRNEAVGWAHGAHRGVGRGVPVNGKAHTSAANVPGKD